MKDMKFVVRTFAFVALLLAPIALAGIAQAQQRDFKGKVDSINEKSIIVDNRKGDKIKFDKVADTTVSGVTPKWEDIKKGDWVAVASKMLEKPRKAYKVETLPPQEEAGSDE
jgi:hypothetical protein